MHTKKLLRKDIRNHQRSPLKGEEECVSCRKCFRGQDGLKTELWIKPMTRKKWHTFITDGSRHLTSRETKREHSWHWNALVTPLVQAQQFCIFSRKSHSVGISVLDYHLHSGGQSEKHRLVPLRIQVLRGSLRRGITSVSPLTCDNPPHCWVIC